MTPAARLNAVLDIIEKTNASRIPMDATIGDYMRTRRYIGAKDRAAIVERVYAMVRASARILWWLDKENATDTPRNRLLAFLILGEGQNEETLRAGFDGSKFGPEPLRAEEETFARALIHSGTGLDSEIMPDAVRAECPPEHEASLRVFYGPDFGAELAGMIAAAPLDLRVNLLALNREEAQESLARDGVETDLTPFCPWGLRARGKVFLRNAKAFTKGHIEIQDEGSQLIAFLCGAVPGAQVLDYCAGAGGKTLALAGAMAQDGHPKGRIVAMDLEPARLEKARGRFRRAHAHDIIEVRPLSDEKSRKWLKRQKGTFDVALVDAPCSGTGTWRRNPDMRWRVFGPSLDTLAATQAEILARVAGTVKPGGRLVYATCSLLPRENEEQVEKFLAAHPDYTVLPVAEIFGNDSIGTKFMRLSPLRHKTDGFFAAVLRRKDT